MNRIWPSLIGALALAAPVGPATARSLSVAMCGQPGAVITIPIDDAPIDDHVCCRDRACHAACDRKRQSRQSASDRS